MARCYDSFYNRYYTCRSGWDSWGRWVVFALIIIAAFVVFLLFACLSARRRRRSGLQPYRGTGWVGRTPFGHGPAQYNPNYNQQAQYNPPPPQYTPQGGYYGGAGQNQGYFGGGQQNGVELQQPSNVYRGGEPVYEPPAGPPPSKKDNPAQ